MSEITIAHSPDADDIFMYYAIKFGWIDTKQTKFNNIAKDIQTLNEAALENRYEICAISFGVYPFIKDEYALLKTAVSFGDGYGPKLIKLKNKKLKKGFSVALSGKHTTNAILFKLYYPDAKIVYMNFLEIEKAVLEGKVDAGVLIHESILTFNENLVVEKELWDIWCELTSKPLPLPLGGMALIRSIPLLNAIKYEEILTKAVKVAREHKKILSNMLLERDLVRIDNTTLNKYLDMYANDNSISLNQTQIEAINKLYQIGFDANIYTQKIDINDYFIPSEYKELRFS